MPGYREPLRPQRRLGGQPGLPKNAVVPTIIVKDQDRKPLLEWQRGSGLEIHIWHLFYDVGFGISLDSAETLIKSGQVSPTSQVFQAPSGATTRKIIHKVPHYHAYQLAETLEEPTLVADKLVDKNGHILPYVKFEGGKILLTKEALSVLDEAATRRKRQLRG